MAREKKLLLRLMAWLENRRREDQRNAQKTSG